MIELLAAKKFAVDNGGVDAIELLSDYNGSPLYRYIPFKGYEGLCLGLPILFRPNGSGFEFLSRDEIDNYLAWQAAHVRYEDD